MNFIASTVSLTRKAFSCVGLFFFSLALSAQLPSGFIDTKIQAGFEDPMGVVFSKDGKLMFAWERKGTIFLSSWNGTAYIKQSAAVLDIRDEVGNWGELGFQSVALDPNFDTNGLIYTYYQVDRHHLMNFGTPQYSTTDNSYGQASISRVTRYKLTNTNGAYKADNASRKILLGETKSTGVPLLHASHAGGQVIFGTDGTLLVSTGDNGTSTGVDTGSVSETYFQQALTDGIIRSEENVGTFRAQMLNSHCGKILRIDPATGNGVASNPHYDAANPRSAKSRVWALGLRNPYRIALKTGTGSTSASSGNPGTLLVGDVQWFSQEELHIIEQGGINCGWPIYEGLEKTPSYYLASADLKNKDETGQPSFQSLCKQPTSLTINADPKQRRFTHFPPALDWLQSQPIARYPDFTTGALVAKTIGPSGALVSGTPFSGSCATSGTYYTGTKFPSNFQKVFFFSDYQANWIKAVSIKDGSTTTQIQTVKEFAPLDFGKGVVDIEYCPLDESIFYVNFTTGDIHRISYPTVVVSNRPPTAALSANKTSGNSPLAVNFSSVGSSDPDNNPITYLWDFGDGTTSTAANPSHTFTATSAKNFTTTLTVKDNAGLTGTKSLQISITTTTPPTETFSATKCYRIIARHSAKDLEIASHSNDNGINIQQGAWDFSRRQVWRIKSSGVPFYTVLNGYSGKAMDVKGASLLSGANVHQFQSNGGDNQKWRFDKNTEGYYMITAKHSGKVLDVKAESKANGANVQQFNKNDGANQQWTVSETVCPTGTAALLATQIYSVDGYREGRKSILTWVSDAEKADYFIVEKLNKNGDFDILDHVNANSINNNSDKNYYSYTDNQPIEGENTYRITLIADNTPPQYSPLISLDFKGAMDFMLFPNPTNDYVDIDLKPFENRAVVLKIINAMGHEVAALSLEKAAKTARMELKDLINGQYIIHIHTSGKRDVTRLLYITK
jgi:glucose/arabinose dehydrogenase/PKD repeat protein